MKRTFFATLAVALLHTPLALGATAEQLGEEVPVPPPADPPLKLSTPALFVNAQLFAGWAPKAGILRLSLDYRYTYVSNNDPGLWAKLTDKTYVQAGITADVSPAFGRYGLYAEWLPLQVLRLRLDWGLYVHHGYIGLLTYDSPNVDWSERARFNAEHERFALTHTFRLTTELRLKIWRIVLLSSAETNYMDTDVVEPYVFELWYGMLTQRQDWIVINRALLLFELIDDPDQTFRIGFYHSVRHAFGTEVTNQRAGVAINWEPTRKWWIFDRPFLIVLAGLHLEDPYFDRPTLLAGVGSSFDILQQ